MTVENVNEAGTVDMICASCGKAEIDDVKLNKCHGGCDLARYCSDKCQQDHLEKHVTACKERVAELRDELLFKQPEISYLGDCPICFLPLPIDLNKSGMHGCCGKVICKGCFYADFYANQVHIQEKELRAKHHKCPFCRKPLPKTDGESQKNHEKRAEANDPVALRQIGAMRRNEGDYDSAFKYLKRAAELGFAGAHYCLSDMYQKGEGVEQDKEKKRYHLEEAAIAGHPDARHNLGVYEGKSGMMDRAVKHFIIAANLGHNESLQKLKDCYILGHVSKDDFTAALRAYQAAVEATKSSQREKAEKLLGYEGKATEC